MSQLRDYVFHGGKQMTSVGLVGFFGWGNYGDELMCRVWQQALPWYSQVVHDLLDPPYFTENPGETDSKHDVIVIGGGDLIRPWETSPLYWNSAWLRKPCIVAGVGVALGERYENERVKSHLSRFLGSPSIQHISARDDNSANWLRSLVPEKEVKTTPDLAFALPINANAIRRQPTVGIVVRKDLSKDIIDATNNVILWATKEGLNLEFIIGSIGRDAQDDLKIVQKEWPESPFRMLNDIDHITDALGEYQLIASAKFHITIMAARMGVPTICLRTTNKILGLASQLELPQLAQPPLSPAPDINSLITRKYPTQKIKELESSAVNEIQNCVQSIYRTLEH